MPALDSSKGSDFDLYLGAAVMPVLAQAMDALVRQITRMKEQGDNLDPKMRARFNPITFLAQQLLRRHPKSAMTPRRQAVYSNFSLWADRERGRREMLRRRGLVENAFNGFMVRRVVRADSLANVVGAVDDTMQLQGALKTNAEMLKVFPHDTDGSNLVSTSIQIKLTRAATHSGASPSRRANLTGWGFEQFWDSFSTVIKKHDVVLYSIVERGMKRQQTEIMRQFAVQAERVKAERERKELEEEQHKLIQEYSELLTQMKENEHLVAILSEDKILTGDDVRKGDAGFEFEVPPCGAHVDLLANFLELLGFTIAASTQAGPNQLSINIIRPSPGGTDDDRSLCSSAAPSGAMPSGQAGAAPQGEQPRMPTTDLYADDAVHRWWDSDLANAWILLQTMHNAEIADGVVEREMLERLLVPPAAFLVLRGRVEEELDHLESDKILDKDAGDQTRAERKVFQNAISTAHHQHGEQHLKPTMEDLCRKLNTSMTRMMWLHKMFESFLESPFDGPPARCGYPDNPASLTKTQMQELMGDINPDLSDAMFEAQFRRIDEDCSGVVEFDEFIKWCMENEVRIDEGEKTFPSLLELSEIYRERQEVIIRLHNRFEECFPEGEMDRYPEEPRSLPKDEVRSLLQELTPGFFTEDDFQEKLAKMPDDPSNPSEELAFTFDKVLEMLDWQGLSEDFRLEAVDFMERQTSGNSEMERQTS